MTSSTRLALIGVAALALTAPGTAGAQDCGAAYTIRAGDTLDAIAARCATSVEALLQANPQITEPGLISVGSELALPRTGETVGTGGTVAEDWARERDERAAPLLAAGHYTVEPGDDMASIATKLGVPLRALLAANADIDPFAIEPGQELVLPATEALDGTAPPQTTAEAGDGEATAGAETPARHTVEPGDSMAGIAAEQGVPLEALMAANEGVEPDALQPGQELVLPQVEMAGAPATASGEAADGDSDDVPDTGADGGADGEATAGAETPARYTVEPGDSMAGIAAEQGVPLEALMAANEGVEPRALQPGQSLVLPGVASEREVRAADPAEEGPENVSGDVAEDGPGTAGASDDAPARTPVQPGPERIALEGRIQKGVECPVLKTPDGQTYSLVSQSYGFTPGEYVSIEAETVEMSFCMQGRTVRVTAMTVLPSPPRGG